MKNLVDVALEMAEIADHKVYDRHAVNWPVVIIYKKNGKEFTFHGKTYDLSLSEACIYADHNIYVEEPVVMTIKVRTSPQRSKVVGVKCNMLYNVVSSNYGKFRIMLQLLDFDGDGKNILAKALSNQPRKEEEYRKLKEEEIIKEEARKKEIMEKEIRARVEKEIRTRLEKEIRTELEKEIRAELEKEVRAQLEKEIKEKLAA